MTVKETQKEVLGVIERWKSGAANFTETRTKLRQLCRERTRSSSTTSLLPLHNQIKRAYDLSPIVSGSRAKHPTPAALRDSLDLHAMIVLLISDQRRFDPGLEKAM